MFVFLLVIQQTFLDATTYLYTWDVESVCRSVHWYVPLYLQTRNIAVCEGKMSSNDIISGASDNESVPSDVPLRYLLPSFFKHQACSWTVSGYYSQWFKLVICCLASSLLFIFTKIIFTSLNGLICFFILLRGLT